MGPDPSHNAGVTVAIVSITNLTGRARRLFSLDAEGQTVEKTVRNINAYLVAAPDLIVEPKSKPQDGRPEFISGNVADDDGALIAHSKSEFGEVPSAIEYLIKPFLGSDEFINGKQRYCLWIEDEDIPLAMTYANFAARFEKVKQKRSSDKAGPRG